jgi:GT2 family glycosyltransferase
MRTAAVVIDWGRPLETKAALESLAAMTPRPDVLIRVDNDSPGIGVEPVHDSAPDGTLFVDLPANIGFAAAVNLGMEVALANGVDWTILLNNDATVEPLCLSRCIDEAARHERVAAIGPAVAFEDRPNTLWFGGGEVSPWLAFTRHRGLMQSSATPPQSSRTDFVSGCCFIVSTAAWRSVGPFRADYFAYYEDAEWCQRANAQGWQCRYVGDVLCLHKVSVSLNQRGNIGLSSGMAYYLARNPLRFALETRPVTRRITRVFGILVIWGAYNAWRALRARDMRVVAAYLQGLMDGMRGQMGKRVIENAN